MEYTKKQRTIVFITISLALGILYFIPYAKGTYYNQMQAALNLTNQQIGTLSAVYGIISLLSYLPSGILADKFSPRSLISLTFFSSALLTLWHATLPSYPQLVIIYALLGLSTNCLFWATAVKVTRSLTNENSQGSAFGGVEGLRFLSRTILSFGSLAIVGMFANATHGYVAMLLTGATAYLLVGILVLVSFPKNIDNRTTTCVKHEKGMIIKALKLPGTWLITLLIFSAYIINAGNQYLTPYCVNVLGMSENFSSGLSIIRTFGLGSIGAVLMGFSSDQLKKHKIYRSTFCGILFILIIASFIPLIIMSTKDTVVVVAAAFTLLIGFFGIGIRGVYWATLGECGINFKMTAIVTGIVSILAFSPDAFISIIWGIWLDQHPGASGFNMIFYSVIGVSIIGLIVSLIISKNANKNLEAVRQANSLK